MLNEQENYYMQNLREIDKFSTPSKELLMECSHSKCLNHLICQNNKVKDKPRLYSGRSKSPKLNLYTYFKENINAKSVVSKTSSTNSNTLFFNQTSFKTNIKLNNIEIESQAIKNLVVNDLYKVFNINCKYFNRK